MVVLRKPVPRSPSRFEGKSKAKYTIAIDQRTGFKHLQRDMVFEPGTNYYVLKDESDEEFNLATDKLNYVGALTPEVTGLRWIFKDVELSIGAIVSAEQLFLPSHASVSNQFIQFASAGNPPVSSGSGVSVVSSSFGAKFSSGKNSQYVLVIFQGI